MRFDFNGTATRQFPVMVPAPGRLNITIWTNATDAGPYAVTGVVGVVVGMSWGVQVEIGQRDDPGRASIWQRGTPLAGVATAEQTLVAAESYRAYITNGAGTITVHGVGENVASFVRLEVVNVPREG